MPIDLLENFNNSNQNEQPTTGGPVDLLPGTPMAQPSTSPSGVADFHQEGHASGNILKMMGRGLVGAGLGTLQGLNNMGYALADLGDKGINALTQKLFNKNFNLQAPHGNVYVGPAEQYQGTLPAEIGENVIAPILGTAMPGEAIASLGSKALGMAGEYTPILAKGLGYGAVSAATTPGDTASRLVSGGLGAAGGTAAHFLTKMPYMLRGKLAKKLENLYDAHRSLGNDLYTNAFKGTEDFNPEISPETHSAIKDLAGTWATENNPVTRTFNLYKDKNNLEGLHNLRSGLAKIQSKLADRALKNGLSPEEFNQSELLDRAIKQVGGDLENNFKNVSPENLNKYLLAQQHWKENVIPFKQFNSVRKLIGPDREVSTRLYTDLTKDSVGAQKLRSLLNTDLGTLQLARILHHKVAGIALPAFLALGGGFGLYHHHNLGEQ